jgi:hypothetical protein
MPRLNNANIPILWTNNNNEAYNNVITQDQNWAVLKLPGTKCALPVEKKH